MKPLQAVHDVKLKICLLSDCVLTPCLPLEYECEHDATATAGGGWGDSEE